MKIIKINSVINHDDTNKIESILRQNGIDTFVIPSNEGITNSILNNEENIILITDGDNIILENKNGFHESHFLSEVNLFRLTGELKINEHLMLINPSTEVEEGFMGELRENIIAEVVFNNKKILNVRLNGGSDIERVNRSAILNRHFELNPEINSGLNEEELFELRQSLNINTVAEEITLR